jgi:L-fuconolactonase
LAHVYNPYIETCIAAFGPDRTAFESSFPPDGGGSSYAVLWNAFKRLGAGYSADEKAKLFSGMAKCVCREKLIRPEQLATPAYRALQPFC